MNNVTWEKKLIIGLISVLVIGGVERIVYGNKANVLLTNQNHLMVEVDKIAEDVEQLKEDTIFDLIKEVNDLKIYAKDLERKIDVLEARRN